MPDRLCSQSMLATGVAVALASPVSATAQDEEIEEIVVTGSHVRRTGYDSRAPIQVVDSARIELIGAERPVDLIKELTVNSGSEMYNETGGHGRTQLNVRNLGVGSTLALINGKRAGTAVVGDATGAEYVDINQFPLVMFERIEVLTDGASATYGSQAVAGVANFITRKGFEGLEISGGYSWAEVDAWQINIAAGTGTDRGHFNVYATYYEQGEIVRSGFDWMQDRLIGQGDISRSRFLSSTGAPGTYRRAVLDPATGEAMDVPGTRNHPDPDCEAAGGVHFNPLDTGGRPDRTCRYHFVDQVSVIASEERAQMFTEFDWNLTDGARYYAEFSYSKNLIQGDRGGVQFNTGRAVGGGITVLPSHPFNFFIEDPNSAGGLVWVDPADWDPAVHTAATLRGIFRPLGAEVENSELTEQFHAERDYTRFMNGVEFRLPGDWFLDVSYVWSKATGNREDPHNYRSDEFQDLVRSGEWNPFGTRLADPGLVSPKAAADTAACANVRGDVCTAANTRVTQDKFDAKRLLTARSTEQVVDLIASGDAFSIGDNTIGLAVGVQFRDSLVEGAAAGTDAPPFGGSQDVLAFFAEAIVPFGDVAEIQLAVRNEDYGGGVSTTDPKVSFEVRPTDWLSFRGSWGTSFQGPTVHQTATTIFDAFIDDPASAVGPGGSLVCVDTGLSNNVSITVEGAPDLGPQESENLALGVIFQTERFRASIDYWKFDYTNLIAPPRSAQAIVEEDCRDDGIPNDPNVSRNSVGQLNGVTTEFVNIGSVVTDGIDLNADYTMEFGSNALIFDLRATLVNSFDVDTNGDGVAEFDGAGSRNFRNNFRTMPKIRANLGGTWVLGSQRANLTARYIDDYRNDQSNDAKVDAWTTLDAQYSYTFSGLIGDGDTTLTLGINNVTDEDPPALARANADGTPITRFRENGTYNRGWMDRPGYDDRAGHNLRGRIVYFRFKQLF